MLTTDNNQEVRKRMADAIHHWFYGVEFHFAEHQDHMTVTLPHLVDFKPDPDDPETQTIEYQQRGVVDNVKAVIKTSKLQNLTFTIAPNGNTEFGDKNNNWYQFIVVITIPEQEL